MARPPCDEQEHSEAERVAGSLREAGYVAHVESFDSRGASGPWLACYAGASALAAVLVYPLPLATAILGIAALVLHARDSDGRPLLFRSSCVGSNAVALARHAVLPGVVVLAPLLDRPGAGSRRSLTSSLQGLMVAVPAGGAGAWIAEVDGELPKAAATAGVAAAVAVVALALLLYRPPAGAPRVSPATDVLLELAPLLADHPVWLVATGAAGSRADAVRALLDEHPRELAGCAWLNLVAGASDGVVAVSEEGAWRERRSDRWLLDTAEEAGAVAGPYRASTSATPLLARHRRALTLLTGSGPEDLRTLVATVVAAARNESPRE